MAIEINNLPPSHVGLDGQAGSQGVGNANPQQAEDGKTGAPAPGSDQVTLTPQARQLRALEARIAEQPEVDGNRVAQIREALANGTFEVNAERIAAKMSSLERALGDAS
ncbi:flagellar biosynthesis anti-sigma factor FlgM [Thiohalobacter sp.]|uniref:flagellar biosynthesis anti-sigma factor FlgM n=1 Tax=Thiohalobacter sp. TaxID=2025948 RepID=UPI002609382B|nr:flagellar biosynthesis anti-sigma factor FlgM [Thiohalobacter sp.]